MSSWLAREPALRSPSSAQTPPPGARPSRSSPPEQPDFGQVAVFPNDRNQFETWLLGSGRIAVGIDVAGTKPARLARHLVVDMAQDAAGVVREQVDRDGGLERGGADAVDVVGRRQQRVPVARL